MARNIEIEDRVRRADAALSAYSNAPGADQECALVDFLADVMHWASAHGQDFPAALETATGHYDAETY